MAAPGRQLSKRQSIQAGGSGPIATPRDLPQVEELASQYGASHSDSGIPRAVINQLARETIESARDDLLKDSDRLALTRKKLKDRLVKLVQSYRRSKPTRIINCAGALLHTNLGRAPFTEQFIRDMAPQLAGYSNLEFDLTAGKRGSRGEFVARQLAELTGAETALIVNNCAGALFLSLNTLSSKKETIISRGELVQIGGGFRVPDIMRRAGTKLIEVGTTNITKLSDYASAITDKTALLLKVSLSNFSQQGFVDQATAKELGALASEKALTLVYDLGSGLAADPGRVGLQGQESLRSALESGAQIVCASGDKLLGGPQAGLILGDKKQIGLMRKNPLYRTLRPDKITLALLSEILNRYLNGSWRDDIPLWSLASRNESELNKLGTKIISEAGSPDALILEATVSRYGGGSLPDVEVPSCAISFNPDSVKPNLSATKLARLFRELERPIIGRIENERFLLDLRAVLPEDEAALASGLKNALSQILKN